MRELLHLVGTRVSVEASTEGGRAFVSLVDTLTCCVEVPRAPGAGRYVAFLVGESERSSFTVRERDVIRARLLCTPRGAEGNRGVLITFRGGGVLMVEPDWLMPPRSARA